MQIWINILDKNAFIVQFMGIFSCQIAFMGKIIDQDDDDEIMHKTVIFSSQNAYMGKYLDKFMQKTAKIFPEIAYKGKMLGRK